MENARQAAKSQWDVFKKELEKKLNSTLSPQEIVTRSEMAPCNCSYLIEDVQVQTPPGHPDFELDFFQVPSVNLATLSDAHILQRCIFQVLCAEVLTTPNCGDWWAELPPKVIFDFNCQVPACSAFPVTFGGIWVNEICNGGDLDFWSITFRIICQETEPNLSCGLGGGYGFISEPITLSKSGSQNLATAYLELIECGCKPRRVH
jgi:hypothetical protein